MRLYRGIGTALAGVIALAFAATTAPAQQAIDPAAVLQERSIGSADAPVTVVEYYSYTCPHCASFHNDVYGDLKKKYVDTGKVRFVYREFPLNGVDLRAGMMARCADPRRFSGLVQVLFKNQTSWAQSSDPVSELAKIGRLAGIDDATFQSCIANEELANGLLAERQKASTQGVQSTPTFEIGGQIYPGSRSIEEFSEIIDPLLANN
ncbi:MAG: DsbA family protein [Rhodospirillaceae bacterium]|nr:DsbA family protein [Rhodospirillaceae bacterium]MBT5945407.1 DsbA family protein [Rhodospirillaceae bacterium]MBT6405828.1 DsbA family protein [Rhodospirillaceae bacterium]MBT6535054.1 DsbA family protein [Rhodospirillaceae bacterium]MBT7362709.1 DsbA family protein [Rhodospirillaceae bacterium]